MVEALIDIATGNVIVVKPEGSVWGKAEVNRVVKLEDVELEKEIAGLDHKVYPYQAVEQIPQKNLTGNPRYWLIQREISLVKIKVVPADVQEKASTKEGILVATDADTPVADAKVGTVLPVPTKTDPDAVIIVTKDPLPEVKP